MKINGHMPTLLHINIRFPKNSEEVMDTCVTSAPDHGWELAWWEGASPRAPLSPLPKRRGRGGGKGGGGGPLRKQL